MDYQNPFQGGNVKPPDMEKVKKAGRRFLPTIIGLLLLVILAANGIYTLNNGEHAVVTRFGRYVGTVETPGLKFKIPFADTAHIRNVAVIRSMEFGFREQDLAVPVTQAQIAAEALMLTGEESRVNGLVIADWVIQYRISNIYNYLFMVESPEATMRSVTQAVYRRVAAANPLDAILTYRKDDIQREVLNELREISNFYRMGIDFTAVQLQEAFTPEEVREAFIDVTKALEERESRINEAQRYRNEEEPRARGRAVAAVNEAHAYKERRVNEAHGAVARYKAIEEEYRSSPDVMRTRLYLEMIREVLPKVDKVYFLDQSSGSMLEILHLGQ
jgi:membrane protease subunit HflK